jgi:glycosyltransferase involved in cell wall biosynthesis
MHPSSLLFSVVICTYQRYDRLPQAIASVRQQDIGSEFYDIWVMDNSPPSPERTNSKQKYNGIPNLHYIELNTPGLANARNVATQQSTGRIIVFLDDDAIATPGWLRHYREAFEKAEANVAAIGGRIVPSFDIPKPAWLHDGLMLYLSVMDSDTAPEGYAPCGANVAFRREALQAAQFHTGLGRRGAESNNLLSGEDSGLTDAILKTGGTFGYAPLASVTHYIPASRLTRAWFRRRVTWQAISDQLQHGLSTEDAPKLWPHIIDYIRKVPREHVPFMGLLWDTDDSELFREQLICTQLFTHILISQGSYPPEMVG